MNNPAGPNTAEGKAIVSMNAQKYGLAGTKEEND